MTPRIQPTQLAAASSLFADGASREEVKRTTGMCLKTLRRHFPNAGWSLSEAGRFGVVVRRANRMLGGN